jgi:hypothetical protein
VTVRPGVALLAFLVPASGCAFDFGFDGTRYRCGQGDRCPEGQVCVAGVCALDPDAGGPDGPGGDGAPPSGACGNLSLLQDTFDVAGAGEYWWDFADPGSSIMENGGQLVIDLPANADRYAGYQSAYYYDLHGGWIVADVNSVAGVTGANTILEVRNAVGAVAQLVHENGAIDANLYNVPPDGSVASRAWNPAERYWRIREDGGQMIWELSTDQETWSELHRRTLPFDVSHVRGVVAAGGNAPAVSQARFDEINPASPSAGFCQADQLVEDFGAPPLSPTWDPYTNPGCTLAETGGALVSDFVAATGDSWCGITAWHLWDFSSGDGLTVDGTGFPSATNFVSYISASTPGSGGSTRIEISLEENQLYFGVFVDDTGVDIRQIPIDRVLHRYWKMRGEGTTVIWETSPDRVDWTERFRSTVPFPTSVMAVNIGAGHYSDLATDLVFSVPGINAD